MQLKPIFWGTSGGLDERELRGKMDRGGESDKLTFDEGGEEAAANLACENAATAASCDDAAGLWKGLLKTGEPIVSRTS